MKFDILIPYDEMENNGKMLATLTTDDDVVVCEIEHTDMMGGHDQINGDVNLEALAVVLVDLKAMIEKDGANFYGWIDMEVDGSTITFTDDTEPFAELQGKQAFILDEDTLPFALCAISSYFWETEA